MSISAQEVAAPGDGDHGLGDVDALFVVTREATPADIQPKVRSTNQRLGRDLEAFLLIGTADDLTTKSRSAASSIRVRRP